ncbi:MAG: hypothetical protein SV583_05035 [Pseudomonadota bacterium]|nr:hypothetical protein [Pseudomonadota bacterium]
MMFLEKLVRADELRPSRLHTQAGEFCGWGQLPRLLPSAWTWLNFRLTGHRAVAPWWTWEAIRFVEKEVRKTDRILEAGAGYSSLWLAERCRAIRSIESLAAWNRRLRSEAAARGLLNLEIVEAQDTSAAFARMMTEAIADGEPYDVVVIDSAGDRTSMFRMLGEVALTIAPRLIVYDNTDRIDDRSAVSAFQNPSYQKHLFRGFGPQLVHAWETTVLLKRTDQNA